MGEINPAPEVTAKAVADLTAIEVDPAKGERLYKAAIVAATTGTTYRMLAKTLQTGKLDLVHYGCTLDEQGKPTTKWAIRRILEQNPERFERELAAIQQAIKDNGEEVRGVWVHDLTDLPDVAAQGTSLEQWDRKMAGELRSAS